MNEPLSAGDIRWNGNGSQGRASTPAIDLLELALLLEHVRRFVRRFVVLSAEQAIAIALWVAHTYAFAAADTTPYLAINSATKRAGNGRRRGHCKNAGFVNEYGPPGHLDTSIPEYGGRGR